MKNYTLLSKGLVCMLGATGFLSAFADESLVDISAAVREAGLTPVVSVTVDGVDAGNKIAGNPSGAATAFNGIWDDKNDAFLLDSNAGFPTKPLVISYAVPASFRQTEKVVLREIVFRTGYGASGVGTRWGILTNRQANVVHVWASTDGTEWAKIHAGTAGEIVYEEAFIPDAPDDKNFLYGDSTLAISNDRSYRHYRIEVASSKNLGKQVIFGEIMLRGNVEAMPSEFSGDITEAVRELGVAPVCSATVNGADVNTSNTCFNGTWGYYEGSTWKWAQDRLLVAKTTGFPATYPFVVTYAVPDGFYPGKDIVVTGIAFRIGAAQSGPGYKWVDYDTRLPTDVKVEGRNDEGEWQFIVRSKGGKLSYEEQTWADSSHPDKVGLYYYSDKKADFVNWLSYRQYRITVYDTGTPSDNNPLQISEILLLGTCGITIEPPSMQTGDITKAVREIGLETAVSCTTHTPAEGSGFVGFDAMTDGLLSRYGEAGSQRLFIANGEQARTTPMVMTIDVPEAFYPGGNVVVTGLTFIVGGTRKSDQSDPEVRALYGNAKERLPTSFALEGSTNGIDWFKICQVEGFDSSGYSVVPHVHSSTGAESDDYMTGTFSFSNRMSARKYRLAVYASDVTTKYPSNNGLYQMSEIQLHGKFGFQKVKGLVLFVR